MPVFIHSFTLSCIHSHIHSHIHSFIDSSTHSFIHVFIHSFVYAFIHSRIYSFTHSFTHLLPSRKNARHLVSLAMVRVSKQKTPAVTGNTAGENASCMTDNRRRFHRQGQPLTEKETEKEMEKETEKKTEKETEGGGSEREG